MPFGHSPSRTRRSAVSPKPPSQISHYHQHAYLTMCVFSHFVINKINNLKLETAVIHNVSMLNGNVIVTIGAIRKCKFHLAERSKYTRKSIFTYMSNQPFQSILLDDSLSLFEALLLLEDDDTDSSSPPCGDFSSWC